MFHILVVEDDRDLNRTVCAFLNSSGYKATGCLSASEAYDAMYDQLFDLIVSDIMMPGIDGFEFAKTVRSLNENIPILFMTARDDFASKQRGYRIGVDDYMVKPIDLDELFLRIGALLRRAKISSSRKLEVGSFSMDMDEHIAMLGEAPRCKQFRFLRRTSKPQDIFPLRAYAGTRFRDFLKGIPSSPRRKAPARKQRPP